MRPRAHYEQELTKLYDELHQLGQAVTAATQSAVAAFEGSDHATAQQLIERDSTIDRMRDEIEQHVLVLIALQQPVAGDLRRLLAGLEIASELERIGDYAKRIGKATLRNAAPPTDIPNLPIAAMGQIAIAMLRGSFDAFTSRDTTSLDAILAKDDDLDRMEDDIRANMLELIRREPNAAEWAMDRTLVAHTIERIGDRVTNMAEQLVFAASGERVDLNP